MFKCARMQVTLIVESQNAAISYVFLYPLKQKLKKYTEILEKKLWPYNAEPTLKFINNYYYVF